ncbi:MAG: hypothetical protein GF334_04075 [Candidatus Altiarchaeales archaeon]|nr:hypothetical protein [Candidatus Altiarchaeales archaeon]
MRVFNKTKNRVAAEDVELADSFAKRRRGLSGCQIRRNLLIKLPFESRVGAMIHMHGMEYEIDVYWINRLGRVVDLKENLPPEKNPLIFWKHHMPCKPAIHVLELGKTRHPEIGLGDVLEFKSKASLCGNKGANHKNR